MHIEHLYFLGERLRRRERVAADEARKNKLAELQDLIHLEGELSEDSVVRALQTRFFNQKYFVSMIDIILRSLGFDIIFIYLYLNVECSVLFTNSYPSNPTSIIRLLTNNNCLGCKRETYG